MSVRFVRLWAIAALSALFLLVTLAPGQSGRRLPKTNDKGSDEVQLSTAEVILPITVRDEFGHLVRGLKESDFIVLENEKRQKVTSFTVEQVPVNVVLLLDASGSVFTEIPAIREAAKKFTDQFTENDKFAVVQFADKIQTLQDWTNDRSEVNHALNWKYRGGDLTLFFDALQDVCVNTLSKIDGRKVIILMTDGVDTGSKGTMEAAFKAAVKAQATVYVIDKAKVQIVDIQKQTGGVGGAISGTKGIGRIFIQQLEEAERHLGELAEMTGGSMYSPLKNDELTKAYKDVADEIKGQYVVTYVSSNEDQDGSYRPIKVALSHAGYTAYSRQGYYANKGQQNQ
ncbi:MAG TPA: VWA domain-containing protein [Blastocatellia bacterium]|nr:VWA domain-containing protein [Blastocatellia bacterium]